MMLDATTTLPTAPELSELLSAFHAVTARLETSHEQLTGEVTRLRGELAAANEALERTRRLAALGEMAAGIAHEIRNPLGAIALNARLLEREHELRGEAASLAGAIGVGVRRLEEIVRDVLAFAREARVRPTEVGTGELFDEAVAACSSLPGFSGVRVERQIEGGAERLWADAGLARSAVVNVVRNSYEAMSSCAAPRGGHVLRLAARGDVGINGQHGGVALVVSDSGPGIPPEALPRIFNPFFTTREAGTGLGLAIVHRIMEAHGGRVSVLPAHGSTHQPSGGAAVTLAFPDGRKDAETCS